ncbi:SCP1.201-like deaminase [Allokutzneria multivorans]|uniref:SCP1.201-like deaminase n=1 Tax=Allokutzneria multivorans TaxID=1142134 RepID=A0ABP7QNR5_9PSEU
MGTLGDVIARLRGVLDQCGQTRTDLNQAADLLDEASTQYAHAIDGAQDLDADEVLGLLARSVADLNDAHRAVVEIGERVQGYIAGLAGAARTDTTAPSQRDARPGQVPPGDVSVVPTRERLEQLRGQLPPPVVSSTGQKTHGRWIDPDGTVHPVVSGWDHLTPEVNDSLRAMGCPRVPVITAADVELKLAALMREKGKTDPRWRHITIVINQAPCQGRLSCETLVPILLPEGYSLTVHAPNYRRRFTGGARPWWR